MTTCSVPRLSHSEASKAKAALRSVWGSGMLLIYPIMVTPPSEADTRKSLDQIQVATRYWSGELQTGNQTSIRVAELLKMYCGRFLSDETLLLSATGSPKQKRANQFQQMVVAITSWALVLPEQQQAADWCLEDHVERVTGLMPYLQSVLRVLELTAKAL